MPVFVSGQSHRMVLWIGGQCDGLFSLNYMPVLVAAMLAEGWAVAQAQLESSQVGSARTHVGDAEDLDVLVQLLVKTHGVTEIALFGTGTGVQVALEFLKIGSAKEWVTRVILQGVVAEPDAPIFTAEGRKELHEVATRLVEAGRGEEVGEMRAVYDLPISAARVWSGGFPTLQEALWNPLVVGDTATVAQNFRCVDAPCLLMIAVGSGYAVTKAKRDELRATVATKCGFVADVSLQFFADTCDERRRMLKTAEADHTAAISLFLREEDRKRAEREAAAAARQAEEMRRSRSIIAKSQLREIQ